MIQGKLLLSKLLYPLGIILILCCDAYAQEWNWTPFNPDKQPWTILAPGPMKPDAEAQQPGTKKGSYTYNDFNGFFAVIYRDSPKRWLPFKPDYKGYIEDVRDDVVKANRGELIKDVEFTNRGMSGREALVRFASGTTRGIEGQTVTKYRVQRFRMFFVGNRFYVVLAVLNENEVNSPAIDKYLNSFAVNTAPTAVANSYSTDEDTILTVNSRNGVLANDKDAEGNALTVSGSKPLSPPVHGSLTLNSDGALSYKPEPNYNGIDTFTYKANDGLIDSQVATVTIIINPVNDPPTLSGVSSTVDTDELATLGFTAIAKDIDSPQDTLRFGLKGAPAGANINPATGALTWTPTELQGPGNYTFQVNLSDGAATDTATVNVTVKEVNSVPTLTAISDQTIDELKPLSVTAKGSDADIPVNNLTYSLDAGAPAGMKIDSQTGVISWAPDEAQGPRDYSITIRLTDNGTPNLSDAKTFKVHVNEINVAPKLNVIGNKTVDEETLLSFKVTATDTDLPANALSYSVTNAPTGASINPTSGEFSWTPTEAQGAGTFAITIHVTDNGSPSLTAEETITIKVNEVNKAPVASEASVNTDEDVAASFTLKAMDADLPSNTLTYTIVNAPAHGRLSGTGPNLTYTPNQDFNGTDSFTFKVNDGSLNSNTATVSINIRPVNDSPKANPDSASTEEDVALTVNVIANDIDVDGDKLVLTNVSNAVNGKAEIIGGEVKFTPNSRFQGTGSFNYTISDGKGGIATGSVTVTVNPAKSKP